MSFFKRFVPSGFFFNQMSFINSRWAYSHVTLKAIEHTHGKKNHIEPNKIILTRWVNKALNQSLTITSSSQG
jgi:hypothetical protein